MSAVFHFATHGDGLGRLMDRREFSISGRSACRVRDDGAALRHPRTGRTPTLRVTNNAAAVTCSRCLAILFSRNPERL